MSKGNFAHDALSTVRLAGQIKKYASGTDAITLLIEAQQGQKPLLPLEMELH